MRRSLIPLAVTMLVVPALNCSCNMFQTPPEETLQETLNQAFKEQSTKHYKKAEAHYATALKQARKLEPKGDRVGGILLSLGEVNIEQAQYDQAAAYLIEAKSIYEKLWNPEVGGVNNRDYAINLAKVLLQYATVLLATQKYQEADEAIAKASQIADEAPASDNLKHDIMVCRAKIFRALGKKKEAHDLKADSSIFGSTIDGRSKVETKGKSFDLLMKEGENAVAGGAYENAIPLYEKAQELIDEEEPVGLRKGKLLLNMGILYDHMKQYEKSERLLSRAVVMLKQKEIHPTQGSRRHFTSRALEHLGTLNAHMNRLDTAEKLYLEALDNELHSKRGEYLREERHLKELLEALYLQQKRYDDAVKLLTERQSLELKLYGEKSKKIGINYRKLGKLYVLQNKNREAIDAFEKSLVVLEKAPDVNPRETLEAYDLYADVLDKTGDTAKAAQLRKKAEDLEGAIVHEFSN